MINSSATYQSFNKILAILLLLAFLIPSGLHAKQLMDFCTMEMGGHSTSETAHRATNMADNHSCHKSDTTEEDTANHHNDCGWEFICVCNIDQSQLGDKKWVPITKNIETSFVRQGDYTPLVSSDEPIQSNLTIRIGEYDPPLWLLYDTLLI